MVKQAIKKTNACRNAVRPSVVSATHQVWQQAFKTSTNRSFICLPAAALKFYGSSIICQFPGRMLKITP
jgi:hypothetical protein